MKQSILISKNLIIVFFIISILLHFFNWFDVYQYAYVNTYSGETEYLGRYKYASLIGPAIPIGLISLLFIVAALVLQIIYMLKKTKKIQMRYFKISLVFLSIVAVILSCTKYFQSMADSNIESSLKPKIWVYILLITNLIICYLIGTALKKEKIAAK